MRRDFHRCNGTLGRNCIIIAPTFRKYSESSPGRTARVVLTKRAMETKRSVVNLLNIDRFLGIDEDEQAALDILKDGTNG